MTNHSFLSPAPRGRSSGWLWLALAGSLAWLTPMLHVNGAVPTITPEDLRKGTAETSIALIIDLRANNEFERGHIPGAINIPHFAIETKSIPPVGAVAVYGDGLGRIDEAAATAAIDGKPGVQASLLAGGLAAWESAGFPTTHAKGLSEAQVPVITYQQLERAQAHGVVLADLRSRGGSHRVAAGTNAASRAPTDLRSAFPGARVVEPGPRAASQSGGTDKSTGPSDKAAVMRQLAGVNASQELIVLIDDGDGSAEQTLLKLRSGGNKRVVILAGGETILGREGRSGLRRVGYGVAETQETSEDFEPSIQER